MKTAFRERNLSPPEHISRNSKTQRLPPHPAPLLKEAREKTRAGDEGRDEGATPLSRAARSPPLRAALQRILLYPQPLHA